mmetsp:Transcript_19302/g.54712  ORF Transcript_19302/g.54712 Transcript_19302/m.54712 type:complete len:304 (+) Transcript_19302:955-1866(+)
MQVVQCRTNIKGNMQTFCQEEPSLLAGFFSSEFLLVFRPQIDLVFKRALQAVQKQEVPSFLQRREARCAGCGHAAQFDDVGMLQGGQEFCFNDEIGRSGAEPIGIAQRIHRQELHGVPAILAGLPKDVLGHEVAVLLLQRRRDLFGMLRLLQVLDQVYLFDFVHVVEPAAAQEFPQLDLVAFESWNALLEAGVDDARMLGHVLGGAGRALPGASSDFFGVHVFVAGHDVWAAGGIVWREELSVLAGGFRLRASCSAAWLTGLAVYLSICSRLVVCCFLSLWYGCDRVLALVGSARFGYRFGCD